MGMRCRTWKLTMRSVILKSRSSSRWARTPARKKILDWPMRYKFGSSSSERIIFSQAFLPSMKPVVEERMDSRR